MDQEPISLFSQLPSYDFQNSYLKKGTFDFDGSCKSSNSSLPWLGCERSQNGKDEEIQKNGILSSNDNFLEDETTGVVNGVIQNVLDDSDQFSSTHGQQSSKSEYEERLQNWSMQKDGHHFASDQPNDFLFLSDQFKQSLQLGMNLASFNHGDSAAFEGLQMDNSVFRDRELSSSSRESGYCSLSSIGSSKSPVRNVPNLLQGSASYNSLFPECQVQLPKNDINTSNEFMNTAASFSNLTAEENFINNVKRLNELNENSSRLFVNNMSPMTPSTMNNNFTEITPHILSDNYFPVPPNPPPFPNYLQVLNELSKNLSTDLNNCNSNNGDINSDLFKMNLKDFNIGPLGTGSLNSPFSVPPMNQNFYYPTIPVTNFQSEVFACDNFINGQSSINKPLHNVASSSGLPCQSTNGDRNVPNQYLQRNQNCSAMKSPNRSDSKPRSALNLIDHRSNNQNSNPNGNNPNLMKPDDIYFKNGFNNSKSSQNILPSNQNYMRKNQNHQPSPKNPNVRGLGIGYLHMALDKCAYQFKQLEKDRLKVESELAEQFPETEISSQNFQSHFQLPRVPSRFDKVVFDHSQEYARIMRLVNKMDQLRGTPLHSGIQKFISGWFEAINKLEMSLKSEFVKRLSSGSAATEIFNDQDILALSSVVETLAKSTRKARTALFCAFTLTTQYEAEPELACADVLPPLETLTPLNISGESDEEPDIFEPKSVKATLKDKK